MYFIQKVPKKRERGSRGVQTKCQDQSIKIISFYKDEPLTKLSPMLLSNQELLPFIEVALHILFQRNLVFSSPLND